MPNILRHPHAPWLAAMNLLTRLAGGATTLALLLHVADARGSLTAAGVAAAAFATTPTAVALAAAAITALIPA